MARDAEVDRFGPLAPAEKVRSLIDEAGFFYSFERMSDFLAQARLDEVEAEGVFLVDYRPLQAVWSRA